MKKVVVVVLLIEVNVPQSSMFEGCGQSLPHRRKYPGEGLYNDADY